MAESDLSERQQAVLSQAREGKTVAGAAEALGITQSAIHQHVSRIRQAHVDISFAGATRRRRTRPARATAAPNGGSGRSNAKTSSPEEAVRRAVAAVAVQRQGLEQRLGELEAEAADVRQAIAKLEAMTATAS